MKKAEMEKGNQQFWTRTARIYNRFTRGKKTNDLAYRELETRLGTLMDGNMKVLELAAGPGTISGSLAARCGHLTVTDFSPAMVAEARKNVTASNVTFQTADATALPFKSGQFDGAVIANALHIMPHPRRALSEIRRVVAPGGFIACPTFTRETDKLLFIEILIGAFGFKAYSRWTHETFMAFLRDQGLEIRQAEEIFGYSFPLSFLVCGN